jgi:ABC-type maltose transport system permease subunit
MIVLKSYFQSIPPELEESALMAAARYDLVYAIGDANC